MIKILINNEEVVCSNNISIKEEMLSTSSTILKNCYPKSWELDKDYVSRYYFPKDYSKCKITDDVYHPEVIGTRVSGTNFTINYNNTLDWKLEELKGDTLQNGTPTPSSPVPIQSVTGLQNVNVYKKNILNNVATTQTINQVVFTRNSDGSFNVNGTASAIATLNLIDKNFILPAGQYTLSGCPTGGGVNTWRIDINNGAVPAQRDEGNGATFTLTKDLEVFNVRIRIANGVNTNNLTFKPMLEVGNTQTTYEPYKGNTYEVNLGKNLLPNLVNTQTLNGMTITKNEDGSLTFNGTANAGTNLNINYASGSYIHLESGKKYTASLTNNNGIYFRLAKVSGGNVITFDTPNKQVTFTSNYTGDCFAYLTILNGTTFDNLTIYPQIELGDGTSYSPYFTPIELNKIGDYEDSIKKSTGKNLFDKDNANVISAFVNGNNGLLNAPTNNQKSVAISVQPNTQYTISGVERSSSNYGLYDDETLTIGTSVATVKGLVSNGKLTFTTGANTKWFVFLVSAGTETYGYSNVMLEQNSQATTYEPYGEVWYVEKRTGRYNIDTSQITLRSNYTNVEYAVIPKATDYIGYNVWGAQTYLCSHAQWSANASNWNSVDDINKIYSGATLLYWWIGFAKGTGLDNIKSELDGGYIIYPLATPTYTEITDETLLSQLENIYNMSLLNGINNITITSKNLPMIMQLYYNYKEAYTSEDLLFCGCIKNTGNIKLNPRQPHFVDLQVLDFKTLLSEGETLNYVITGKTIEEAINQVVNSISDYGFVVGNIEILNPNDIINAYSTLNKTAYDVFQYIADITQSRWTTRMIDENTIAIDFYDPTLMPTGTPIESTQAYYENNQIVDISFNYSTNDYRNKQIMTSDEVFANITQTETIIADGYTQNFMCQNKLGIIETITLNGVSKTFATKSEQELGITADFYYQPGEMQFVSSNTIGTGSVIIITYYPIVKGREIILNTGESTRIQTQIGRKGTLSRYENRNDTTSSQELQKIGQSYIKYKGQAEIQLKVKTKTNLWNVGEILSYNAPIEELSTEYMVKSKEVDWYAASNETFYIYELTSNFNYENAVNYFDNQRAKNQGNIGEGETITRNIDLESTALILFYDTDVEEVEILNPTSLDFALDGVII